MILPNATGMKCTNFFGDYNKILEIQRFLIWQPKPETENIRGRQ